MPTMEPTFICTIDAGHGGHDPGAVNATLGLRESDIALSVSRSIVDRLNQVAGVKAFLTREGDEFLTLSERPRLANQFRSNATVSIHCNSSSNQQAHGWEVFTTRLSNRSDALATCIGESYAESLPGLRARFDYSDGDLDKEANFAVIKGTDHPSCLLELGFISNDEEARILNDTEYQLRMTEAIVGGLLKFAGVGKANGDAEPETSIDVRLRRIEETLRLIQTKLNT